MKNKFLFCLALLCLSATLISQISDTAITGRYNRETIWLSGNSNRYCKDKVWKNIGLAGQKLGKEFMYVRPETYAALKSYQKHRKKGVVFLIAGGALLVSGLAVLPVTLPLCLALGSPGLVAYCGGIFHLYKSRRTLQKTIWLRNRDVLVDNNIPDYCD
jgi:hypothetical protein